jgi:hypothetical protein
MLEVACPHCQKVLQVADNLANQESQCPACAQVFRPGHPARIEGLLPTAIIAVPNLRRSSDAATAIASGPPLSRDGELTSVPGRTRKSPAPGIANAFMVWGVAMFFLGCTVHVLHETNHSPVPIMLGVPATGLGALALGLVSAYLLRQPARPLHRWANRVVVVHALIAAAVWCCCELLAPTGYPERLALVLLGIGVAALLCYLITNAIARRTAPSHDRPADPIQQDWHEDTTPGG